MNTIVLFVQLHYFTSTDEVSRNLMDNGTCAESLRNPDLRTNQFGHRKDFSWAGAIRVFPCGGQIYFPAGPAAVKFYFTNSKLRKKFINFQNPGGPKHPAFLPTPMQTKIIM